MTAAVREGSRRGARTFLEEFQNRNGFVIEAVQELLEGPVRKGFDASGFEARRRQVAPVGQLLDVAAERVGRVRSRLDRRDRVERLDHQIVVVDFDLMRTAVLEQLPEDRRIRAISLRRKKAELLGVDDCHKGVEAGKGVRRHGIRTGDHLPNLGLARSGSEFRL